MVTAKKNPSKSLVIPLPASTAYRFLQNSLKFQEPVRNWRSELSLATTANKSSTSNHILHSLLPIPLVRLKLWYGFLTVPLHQDFIMLTLPSNDVFPKPSPHNPSMPPNNGRKCSSQNNYSLLTLQIYKHWGWTLWWAVSSFIFKIDNPKATRE